MKYGVEIEFKDNIIKPTIPPGWSFTREPLTHYGGDSGFHTIYGQELRTNILTQSSSIDTIIETITELKRLNPDQSLTNKHCGFHVHIDKRSLVNPVKFIGVFVFAEDLLFKLHPESRQNNRFCTKVSNQSLRNRLLGGEDVLFPSYKEHAICYQPRFGTYELRHAAGRSDRGYIANWIGLILLVYLLHDKVNLSSVGTKEGLLAFLSESCSDDNIASRQAKILQWIEEKV